MLCLSASDSDGIERQAKLLVQYLQDRHGSGLMDDLVYTLGQRRSMHKYRYAIHGESIQEMQSILGRTKFNAPKASGDRRLAFLFTGQGAQWPRMGCELLSAYPVFNESFQAADKRMKSLGATWSLLGISTLISLDYIFLTCLVDELHRGAAESKVDEAYVSQPLCTTFQIALVNLLRSWNIHPGIVVGHSSGEIAAAYTAGMLSLDSAIDVAYYRGKLSSQMMVQDGTPSGAMLAVALSAEEIQPYIEGVKMGKATIACINSPRSVTLSGDVAAIQELQSRLEERGLFNRKLKVNVAYHSVHMRAIAEEYSRSLRGLDVQPRHQDVTFYSSVSPGIPVETTKEYWVQNLLSPVRFSEAIRHVIESQTERTLTCIEIGPHSALAGPFKQICQSSATGIHTEYLPSVLRKQDSVQNALNLACNLFYNGCNVDLASINFPVDSVGLQVLTDLPPYSWNHNTQYWHEGRLSQNYLYRMSPPHDLLGTLSDDSSDIDMRWTKYIRQSELPWLKDHVIRSEVLLPAGAYLAMVMQAVKQKASISGLQVKGYTLRDVSFSKALVVPDTLNGVEISLVMEPFRQSSPTASSDWNEFRVISFGSARKAYEHCHGLISVTQTPNFDFSSRDETKLATMRHSKDMKSVLYKQWMTQAASNGNEMGSSFQLVSRCCLAGDNTFFTLRVPERFDFESPLTISVPLLDAFLQITVLSLVGMARGLDGTTIPVSIAEMIISESISQDPGHELLSRGSTTELGPRDFEGRVIVAQDKGGFLEPVVQVNGAKFVSMPRDQESSKSDDKKTKLCWNMFWEDDIDDLSQENVVERWSKPQLAPHEFPQTVMSERAVWHCLRSAYECLTDCDIQKMAPHHRNYYSWMKWRYNMGKAGKLPFQQNGLQQDWSCTDLTTIEHSLQEVAANSTQGCMTIRLGRRLLEILRGDIEPLSLMLEDDLLNRYYAENRGQDRVYEQAAHFIRLAAHKNPRLRILEIGAGTGYVLPWITLYKSVVRREVVSLDVAFHFV